MNPRKPNKDDKANSLWTLREKSGGLDKFIGAHPLEVDQEAFESNLKASFTPSVSRSKGHSK